MRKKKVSLNESDKGVKIFLLFLGSKIGVYTKGTEKRFHAGPNNTEKINQRLNVH